MSIKDKVNSIIDQVEADPSGTIASAIGYRAVEAILNGIGSQEWEDYMGFFADTPAELSRLTFRDPRSQDADIKQNIIYLAAYATCGATTLMRTREAIDRVIDDGL